MIFGQGFDSASSHTNIGVNDLEYSYQDRYGANKVYTDNHLTVLVNQ